MDATCFYPLVSVVVITYNSAEYVVETLESIREQTYENIELIVTDDCSSDDTVKVCAAWLRAHKIRFAATTLIESEKNTGIAKNCNRGAAAANGEWVKIIAGDDALEPGAIAEYISYASKDEKRAVLFSNIQAYNDAFLPANRVSIKSNKNEKFNLEQTEAGEQFQILLRMNCVNSPTVMLKKTVLMEVGGFDENFTFLEDYPLWLALTKAGHKMNYVNTVSVKYRVHRQSVQGLHNRKMYKSRVEMEVDRMFVQRYLRFLLPLERWAKQQLIYRDIVLVRLFKNKSNNNIRWLAKITGCLPSFVLKRYRKMFLVK